jgi:hypothetical protein
MGERRHGGSFDGEHVHLDGIDRVGLEEKQGECGGEFETGGELAPGKVQEIFSTSPGWAVK